MAFEVNTGSTMIEFGTNLRIGYRPYGSLTQFVYFPTYPTFNQLPYTFNVPSAGVWEIEYAQICQTCSGTKPSNVETTVVTVTA